MEDNNTINKDDLLIVFKTGSDFSSVLGILLKREHEKNIRMYSLDMKTFDWIYQFIEWINDKNI
jgi:hypothetical protein